MALATSSTRNSTPDASPTQARHKAYWQRSIAFVSVSNSWRRIGAPRGSPRNPSATAALYFKYSSNSCWRLPRSAAGASMLSRRTISNAPGDGRLSAKRAMAPNASRLPALPSACIAKISSCVFSGGAAGSAETRVPAAKPFSRKSIKASGAGRTPWRASVSSARASASLAAAARISGAMKRSAIAVFCMRRAIRADFRRPRRAARASEPRWCRGRRCRHPRPAKAKKHARRRKRRRRSDAPGTAA
ncbi:MAG: hypothetical protein BWZ10_00198 [candidate division BRC1 bacterium ADurb.BinA364]|nr:MAG: hypothetical protein BWZ10_00198 [candidate division BRC1 bacterium ADurb.BinA364]